MNYDLHHTVVNYVVSLVLLTIHLFFSIYVIHNSFVFQLDNEEDCTSDDEQDEPDFYTQAHMPMWMNEPQTTTTAFIHSFLFSDPALYSIYVIKSSLYYPINRSWITFPPRCLRTLTTLLAKNKIWWMLYFLPADGPLPIFSLFCCQYLLHFDIISLLQYFQLLLAMIILDMLIF